MFERRVLLTQPPPERINRHAAVLFGYQSLRSTNVAQVAVQGGMDPVNRAFGPAASYQTFHVIDCLLDGFRGHVEHSRFDRRPHLFTPNLGYDKANIWESGICQGDHNITEYVSVGYPVHNVFKRCEFGCRDISTQDEKLISHSEGRNVKRPRMRLQDFGRLPLAPYFHNRAGLTHQIPPLDVIGERIGASNHKSFATVAV